MQGLTAGRIVHYVDRDGAHLPAIVAELDGERGVGYAFLIVFAPRTMPYPTQRSVGYSAEGGASTWHWIERA